MDTEKNGRTTAVGLARYAMAYLQAAEVVDNEMGRGEEYARISPVPAYFLLVHGMELTLKAYLRHCGLTVEVLRGIGHELMPLLEKSRELGLDGLFVLTETDTKALKLLVALNQYHQLRYIQTGLKEFPSWAIAMPFAFRLHQAIGPVVGFKSFTMAFAGY